VITIRYKTDADFKEILQKIQLNWIEGGDQVATIKLKDWETPENLELIEGWARDGLTDKDIAYNIGIAESTFNRWKKRSPSILKVLKNSKEVADRRVENALFKSALGYQYTEVTKERDESGCMIVTKEVVKDVKPNVTAQIYWLKNRIPKVWRDHPELMASPEESPILSSLVQLLQTTEKEGEQND